MVKINKVYTKTGDQGKTSFNNRSRILKSHIRIEAIGQVDELNAFIGWAKSIQNIEEIKEILHSIQNDLFDLGADLYINEDMFGKLKISQKQVESIEQWIDYYNKKLPELNSFIIPGENQIEASFHIARVICRRVERVLVNLSVSDSINPCILSYINRLSDLLFVFTRIMSKNELLWEKGKNT